MATATSSFGVSKRESHDASGFYARQLVTAQEDLVSVPQDPDPASLDQLICSSADNMKEVTDNSVALVVTSPPYHNGADYDTDDTLEEFVDSNLYPVLRDCYRVVEPGGRIAINVAGQGRKPYFNYPGLVDSIMTELGFLSRGQIIWIKAEGASGSCAWGSWMRPSNPSLRDVHEMVLVYSKARFDRHPYRKGPKRPDEDKEAFMRDTLSVWRIPPASAKRTGHPCPFPVELPKRLIELYTWPGELVLDPYMGSGSTAVAAKMTGRHYVGYDTDANYLATAEERLGRL